MIITNYILYYNLQGFQVVFKLLFTFTGWMLRNICKSDVCKCIYLTNMIFMYPYDMLSKCVYTKNFSQFDDLSRYLLSKYG